MEEVYKPDATDIQEVDIYSRENNDILGDMPNWLIHTGSYIIYSLIALLFLGVSVLKYPNVIKADISIDDMTNVEWITANRSGKIDRFFISNRSEVRENDTLAILKNAAQIEDVKRMCRVLFNIEEYYRTDNIKYLESYPFNLIMGEMTAAYEQFTEAVRTNLMYRQFDIYPQKKAFLEEELRILQRNNQADELSILKIKRELFEAEIEHKIELNKNKRLLELAYENITNSLKTWETNYLIKSSRDGIVILGESWGMSNVIDEGDTICTVIAQHEGRPTGHIKLSQSEVGGISIGNKVNIELSKYPAHTYGYLSGDVSSISYIPHNNSYAVEIEFPFYLITTTKKEIIYEIGLSGKAEIVTSSRSILSRIFEPILQLLKK